MIYYLDWIKIGGRAIITVNKDERSSRIFRGGGKIVLEFIVPIQRSGIESKIDWIENKDDSMTSHVFYAIG